MAVHELNEQLLISAKKGQTETVAELLKRGAEAGHQETREGMSPMMGAARGGHVAVVRRLLEAGAPWNAVDRAGRCAGDHAMAALGELELTSAGAGSDVRPGGSDGAEGGEEGGAMTAEGITECFNALLNAGGGWVRAPGRGSLPVTLFPKP